MWSDLGLDMPNLKNVVFQSAFVCKDDVTIEGGARAFPLSRVDIGELRQFFNQAQE